MPRVVFPLYERFTRRRLWTEARRLRELQWRPAEELEARALGRVRQLLEHARTHVPYYRTLLGDVGAEPKAIRTVADLARLPLTTKAALRRRGPDAVIAANLPARRRWPSVTSGSTGRPFAFYGDTAGLDEALASYLFFLDWAGAALWQTRVDLGVRLGRSWVNTMTEPSRWSRRARRILLGEDVRGVASADLSAVELRALVASLPRREYFVRAYPAYAARLAARLAAEGVGLPRPPRVLVSCAETLTAAGAAGIARAFGCAVVNHYSAWEVLHLAQTCPENPALLHVNTERAVTWVARPDGAPAAIGEQGRLVVTVLSNFVQPFVNYDIGDWATAAGTCPCGRGFPTLSRLEGRSVEVLRSPSGRIVSPIVLNQLPSLGAAAVPAVWEYQAVQTGPDTVRVRVVPASGFTAQIAREIGREVGACLGPDVTVTVEAVDEIPLERSGKRPIIVPWSAGGRGDG